MLATLIIVFREVLEAGLIVGVVLAASRGVPGRDRAVALGILAGIAGSLVVAVFASRISDAFDGRGQEIFNAVVLAVAVVMLTWHVVWMAGHAREMTMRLKALGHEVAIGHQSVAALGIAVAAAVMREGSEVVLFLSGIVMQGHERIGDLLIGGGGGIVLGAVVSATIYFGLAVVPLKRVFQVTGALVTLLAAGLGAEAVHQLSNVGLLNVLDTSVWDTSWLLPESGWAGSVLHVLIGYRDQPTGMELAGYLLIIVTIALLARQQSRPTPARIASTPTRTA
jgi:high-affinity iron transporter